MKKKIKNELGDFLRKRGEELKYTQKEVSELLDVSYTYYNRIILGKEKPPSSELLKKISKLLEIDIDYLHGLAKKMPDYLKTAYLKEPEKVGKLIKNLNE